MPRIVVSFVLLAVVTTGTQTQAQYYRTKEEAVKHVPQHVEPKACFVWRDGSQDLPWRVIPGTGCAHWVAHQKGIRNGVGCYDGHSIRVRNVVEGKKKYPISEARVGDIWANERLRHCGIVMAVSRAKDSVTVKHCSSGQGGVVTDVMRSGNVYR